MHDDHMGANDKRDDKQSDARADVSTRSQVTCILVLLAISLFLLGYIFSETTVGFLLSNLASGTLVLSFAIWISYFAEKSAVAYLHNRTRNFDARLTAEINKLEQGVSLLATANRAGLSNLYFQEVNEAGERHDAAYKTTIARLLNQKQKRIRILAIAGRDFFAPGLGISGVNLLDLSRKCIVEILLLHPWCEAAVSRGLREGSPSDTFEDYQKTQLYEDIIRSCRTLDRWMKEAGSPDDVASNDNAKPTHGLTVRLYKTVPTCFLLLLDDVCFLEQYHFGTGGRASGKVPTAEVRNVHSRQAPGDKDRTESTYYGELEGHFLHVWETAEEWHLDRNGELLETLENPPQPMIDNFNLDR